MSPGAERSRTVIGAISEAHLEAIVDRLKRDFEVEANVGRPAVGYVESLTRAAEGSAKHVGIAWAKRSTPMSPFACMAER